MAAGWNEKRAIFDTTFAKTQHGLGTSLEPATDRILRHMIDAKSGIDIENALGPYRF